MTRNVLFEEKHRTDSRPSKHLENLYDFLDRTANRKFVPIRSILNAWYSHYPEEEKVELQVRMKELFYPAFYELFLHELFLKQGFTVQIHPTITGSSKKPDFLISKNGIDYYVEAKVSNDKSQKEASVDNRIYGFYDQLNTLDLPHFFIRILKLTFKTNFQPSCKKAIAYFE